MDDGPAITETNKALIRKVIDEIINAHNADGAAALYAEDYIQHNPHVPSGRAAVQGFMRSLFAAFPDIRAEIVMLMAEHDRVFVLLDWTGTHGGPFAGRPATGNPIAFRSAEIFRIEDGIIVEHWDAVQNAEMQVAVGLLAPVVETGDTAHG